MDSRTAHSGSLGDGAALAAILASHSPAEAKTIGRRVRNYDDDAWALLGSPCAVR